MSTSDHDITLVRSPVNVIIRCTCGWSKTISTKQNALARASKVRAAIAAHRLHCGADPFDPDPNTTRRTPSESW